MALLNASSEAQATELWLQHDCEWRGCVWEGVYCMCRMCYVISACQAGVSGINKHATKITEQESDTHAQMEYCCWNQRERDHVTSISLQPQGACVYNIEYTCVKDLYGVKRARTPCEYH